MRALLSLSILAALALTAGCRRDSSYETCTPGNSYLVGCSRNVGLECSGDPTITVCTDDITPSQCLNSVPERIAFNDDSGGTLCSEVTFVCPSSGRVSVNAEPFASRSYRCVYDVIDLSP
jgi:hypothetical protein